MFASVVCKPESGGGGGVYLSSLVLVSYSPSFIFILEGQSRDIIYSSKNIVTSAPSPSPPGRYYQLVVVKNLLRVHS